MTTDTDLLGMILDDAHDLLDGAVELRRDLHVHPELGNELPRTQATVLEALEGLGLDISTGESVTSVTADLVGEADGAADGRTILLRGDMDALEMPEDTGLAFASETGDTMHACGHDSHVAMLVGAARLLSARKADLAGRVRFMFQPGEEGHHGAQFMIDEGVLDGVDAAFAIHSIANIPSGMLTTRGGPIMAAADEFHITITGRGGHASMPHDTLDPIPIACEIVGALQTLVTRRVSVFDPGVITVGHINAGTTTNVIPEVALIEGTMRSLSAETRTRLRDGVKRVAEGIAEAHDAECEVEFRFGYPVTINDDPFARFTREVTTDLLGGPRVFELPTPVMGAEDFSYLLEQVPGAMAFLGVCPPDVDPSAAPPNHSNKMVLYEAAMTNGIAAYAAVATAYLSDSAAASH